VKKFYSSLMSLLIYGILTYTFVSQVRPEVDIQTVLKQALGASYCFASRSWTFLKFLFFLKRRRVHPALNSLGWL
jgi:hypothetical protein